MAKRPSGRGILAGGIGLLTAWLTGACSAQDSPAHAAPEPRAQNSPFTGTPQAPRRLLANPNNKESQAERGVSFQLDGKTYYLNGPLVDGKRDIPGHTWSVRPNGKLDGYHYNTGPFGMPSWWSSDAGDGVRLYTVDAEVAVWSPATAAQYIQQGYVHYHKLVTLDRQPHPTKVVFMRHHSTSFYSLDGGPRPWLAHAVTPGIDRDFQPNAALPYPPREHYAYVGCVDTSGQNPDFLAVVGVDPADTASYGQVSYQLDMPLLGDEVHHYGYNSAQTRLLVPGLFSGRLHEIDVATNPAQPALLGTNHTLTASSGYTTPHTVIGLPSGGYLLTMIGADTASSGPGGMVEVDPSGQFLNYWGPGPVRGPGELSPSFMYDVGINLIRNRMISTSFGLPADVGPGITISGLGDEVNVWDYATRQVLQTVKLGTGTGPLEVRWLSEPGTTIGFTNAPGTSEIWRWNDLDEDGIYTFEVAISLPALSVPTDILLSHDDRYLYISNWAANEVLQYDIQDPFNPVLTGSVSVPWAQMLRISPDNQRLYVTNSLLSTWDDTEFPAGVTRNSNYGLWKVDVDHANGGMAIDPGFFVDFDALQARPHQVFFDPNIRRSFGDH